MYHYMTKKKGSFALLMILLVAEGVAGVFFSLVMSSLVDDSLHLADDWLPLPQGIVDSRRQMPPERRHLLGDYGQERG